MTQIDQDIIPLPSIRVDVVEAGARTRKAGCDAKSTRT